MINLSLRYFDNTLQSYLIFFLILGTGFILGKILLWISEKFVKSFAKKTNTNLDDILVEMLEKPIFIFINVIFLIIAWNVLSFPNYPKIDIYFGHIVYMIIVLNSAWILHRLINAIIHHYLYPFTQQTETDLDDHLLPIIKRLISIVIYATAVIMILNHFGQEIGPMLAGLGIGGIAFALAAKDIISNLFGSITILADKPFKVGERVRINGNEGFVKEIGLRTTKIETFDGTNIYVPNMKFTDSVLENVSQEWARRIKMNIGLTYDTSATKMRKAKQIIENIINNQPGIDKEKYRVVFDSFGDYSKNIMVIYWITDKENIFSIKDEVNFAIMESFEKNKLDFAFPTQTIQLKK